MRITFLVFLMFVFLGCSDKKGPLQKSEELITAIGMQSSLFNALLATTNDAIPGSIVSDSLAFLLLPLYASCPACRDKTIDKIVRTRNDSLNGRYIIISINGGRKSISKFFRDRNSELPVLPNRLFLDSTNEAYKYNLYDKNPVIYYSFNKMVYKKVVAIPLTIKDNLREFFRSTKNDLAIK